MQKMSFISRTHRLLKKRAFTLAEVLITLTIIGVVAALTIPQILNYTYEKEAVSKVKKTYATLAQAVLLWQTENGCIEDSKNCSDKTAATISRGIAKYLNVVESAYAPSNAAALLVLWLPKKTTLLTGGDATGVYQCNYPGIASSLAGQSNCNYLLLQDNTVVNISFSVYDSPNIVFDINGVKPPNRVGKDQFATSLYSYSNYYKSLNPYVSYGAAAGWAGICYISSSGPCNADDGHSPTAYVLAHDSLPDFKAMGYPISP
jgi:prepilin-type N-terminal cleavage/methylation domain-containing protein